MLKRIIDRIKGSDIAKRMMQGAFWSFTGTALGKFCVFVTGIVCAQILGKEQFGELGMVRSTIGMFIILGAGGIGVTATRYISSYRKEQKSHAASIYRLSTLFSLCLGIGSTVLLLVSANFIAVGYLHSAQLYVPLLIGCGILLMSILNSSENGALAGLENFRAIALNTLLGSLVESAGMIVGAYFFQLEGAIAGFGLGVMALWLANRLSALRSLRKADIDTRWQPVYKEDWHLIWQYSIPATLSALSVTPVFWFLRSMLVRADDFGELGIFEAADQWKVILLFIPGALSQIVLPILSSITDNHQFRRTLMANLAMVGGITTLMAVASFLLAPLVMPLYGKAFLSTAPMAVLATSTIPTAIAQILEMTLYSRDKMWTCLAFNILWGVAAILFAHLFLQQQMGATGLALAVLAAYVVKVVCFAMYILNPKK